ncbi:translation initiation factor eIF-2B subunit epsilon-like [Mercenaria mercenaria]|uniref:translation initiation factor eIF-2B subunit epsilon-like n=1 Tax=Mercenaria mercenaria TaxID=6596 RepID=UPI00234E3F40|nr:translation initiation factor eIF-2B subunit epsilon-like [Mercenaria mercenaria]
MAPKGKSGASNADLKQEDIVQAVVFADSFNTNFAPISADKPRALFPVANTALLDYTLEFLCSGGVQEIFVLCCHHAGLVKQHLQNSRWNEKSSPCNVVPIVSEGCMSMGDALRDIDAKSLIRSDFILIYGDVVSNIKLQPIMEEHKKRHEKDKSAIMTMVFRQAPPGHTTRSAQDDVILAIDNQTQNVIHYQKVGETGNRRFQFPLEVMTEHKDVQIRYDLLDANISICSPQVPQLFTDNFDYETRDSFVRGILINEEIMGNTIQMHVVKDAYAARISNLQMYDAVSQDILNRWTFPFVPDSCYRHNKDSISYGRHNVYMSKNVTLARECKIEENVLLGNGSSVGSHTVISHSVIGRNCQIGKNVTIKGSYLWDGVTVEDNCKIDTSLICDNVTVYDNVILCPGCVLNSQVSVGPDVELKAGTVAVSRLEEDDFGEEVDATDGDITEAMYGSKARAFTYKDPDDDMSDTEEITKHIWGLTVESESSEEEDSDRSSESGSEPASLPPDVPVYYTEMLDTIQRSKDENISPENLILEINSLKHAYNITIKELTGLVVKVMLEQPFSENPSLAGAEAIKVLKETLARHMSVLQNYIKNEESQLQCLKAVEVFGTASSVNMALVMKLIHFLYDSDILAEQSIFRWYKAPPSNSSQDNLDDVDGEEIENKHAEIRKHVAPLIKWLEEADEESSEDD